MRNLPSFVVASIVCFCLLIGCVKGFKIVVIDSGCRAPIFRLMSYGVVSSSGVEIDNFNIYRFPGKGEDFIWGIESKDKKRHLIEEIKYGVVPDGFREILAPQNLVAGGHYVAGSLMAGKMGSVDFVLK